MGRHSAEKWAQLAALACAVLVLCYVTFSNDVHDNYTWTVFTPLLSTRYTAVASSIAFNPHRDDHRYGLSDPQCDAAFPGLFDEIYNTAARRRQIGNVTRAELDAYARTKSTIRAMIHSGSLYVIHHQGVVGKSWAEPRVRAILHSIHRAIVAAANPRDLPDVEFVLHAADSISEFDHEAPPLQNKNITSAVSAFWALSRREEDDTVWLMPDFGFWAWGKMSTLDSIKTRVEDIEEHLPFEEKTDKLLWRGRVWIAPTVRQPILHETTGRAWADVVGLVWDTGKFGFGDQWVEPADHCKWKYLLYAEGVSFSGRLKYLQTCHSVIISPPITWVTPMRRLLSPSGPSQNYVEIASDFSNLNSMMEYLLGNAAEARRIADNSVRVFRDLYNSPAAEACYWRRLITEWSKVSEPPAFYEDESDEEEGDEDSGLGSTRGWESSGKRKWRGVPFEDFAVDWPRGD